MTASLTSHPVETAQLLHIAADENGVTNTHYVLQGPAGAVCHGEEASRNPAQAQGSDAGQRLNQLGQTHSDILKSPAMGEEEPSVHSMADDKPHSNQAPLVEPSEEELLQWQPIFPAKSRRAGAAGDAVVSKPADSAVPAKKYATAAVKSSATRVQAAAAKASAAKKSKPTYRGKLSASTGLPATNSRAPGSVLILPATSDTMFDSGFEPTQTRAPVVLSVLQPASGLSMPSASVSALAPRHSLQSASSLSSLPPALHAQPLRPQQSVPQLPYTSPKRDAAAPAPASLSASIDSDWLAADAHPHRHSISSWSSEASDAHLLRHSATSTASRPSTVDPGDTVSSLGYAVTGDDDAVTASHALDMPLASLTDWKKLDATELQSQTAALLSSVTTSLDWDLVATDAQLHGDLAHRAAAEAQSHRHLDRTALLTHSSEPLSHTALLSASLGTSDIDHSEAAAARWSQGPGQFSRAVAQHSLALSASSAGLLSSHLLGTVYLHTSCSHCIQYCSASQSAAGQLPQLLLHCRPFTEW